MTASDMLVPRNAWADNAACDVTAKKLARLLQQNFKRREAGTSAEIRAPAARANRKRTILVSPG